jgi:hypothetical protein
MVKTLRSLCLAASCALFSTLVHAQLTFSFDYTYDTGFFTGANSSRQVYLNSAASYLSSYLSATNLSAITPSGSNSWTAKPFDPQNSSVSLSISNPSIAANTIVVYVGAYDLPDSTLGIGGPGSWSGSGFQPWFDTLNYRGNGSFSMPATGSITFDSLTSWYFDSDITTVESGLMAGKSDFFSVATHELAHLLGFGTSASWSALVSNGTFTGNASTINFGGNVILTGDAGHWADGTASVVAGTSANQETLMDPSLTIGTRKYITTLDLAGVKDIGFTVTAIPEPSAYAFCFGLAVLGWCCRRRRVA